MRGRLLYNYRCLKFSSKCCLLPMFTSDCTTKCKIHSTQMLYQWKMLVNTNIYTFLPFTVSFTPHNVYIIWYIPPHNCWKPVWRSKIGNFSYILICCPCRDYMHLGIGGTISAKNKWEKRKNKNIIKCYFCWFSSDWLSYLILINSTYQFITIMMHHMVKKLKVHFVIHSHPPPHFSSKMLKFLYQ